MAQYRLPFTLGFRPFFLLAGPGACILLLLWLGVWFSKIPPQAYYPGASWHGHEMIFGFAVAVLAGFLLTAAHNWTGQPTIHGKPLAALSALWLAGRILPFCTSFVPPVVIALVDCLFLPCLALGLAIPIMRIAMWRNIGFPLLLMAMASVNALMHAHILGEQGLNAYQALNTATDIILLIIVWIFGRIYPFFASRVLPNAPIKTWPVIEFLSIITMIALIFGRYASPEILKGTAMAAALIHSIRLFGMHAPAIWRVPLIWVLWTGYLWLIIAFICEALGQPVTVTRHAYTIGAIGVLTLGMMARVSIGHTGRKLVSSPMITFMFVLTNLAAAVRVFGPLIHPASFMSQVAISGFFWTLTFFLFTIVFVPILAKPRPDGKPN